MEKGKIPEDYAQSKFGFQSLAELLRFIDEEEVDEDRLFAVSAMFYALNRSNAPPGEEVLNYQLFKISKKLSSSQLLLLNLAHQSKIEIKSQTVNGSSSHDGWLNLMSDKIGHNVKTHIKQDEEVLITLGLISDRIYSDRSGISGNNGRITDLGDAFCERINLYKNEVLE